MKTVQGTDFESLGLKPKEFFSNVWDVDISESLLEQCLLEQGCLALQNTLHKQHLIGLVVEHHPHFLYVGICKAGEWRYQCPAHDRLTGHPILNGRENNSPCFKQPPDTLESAQWDWGDQMYCLKRDSTVVSWPVSNGTSGQPTMAPISSHWSLLSMTYPWCVCPGVSGLATGTHWAHIHPGGRLHSECL